MRIFKAKVLDYKKAPEDLSNAIRQSVNKGHCTPGEYIKKCNKVQKRFNKVYKRYQKAVKQNSQFQGGYAYWIQNWKKAVRWLQKAALQDNAEAQAKLVNAYWEGIIGGEQSFEKGAEWALKAALQGHPYAQYILGETYWQGKGIERNPTRAVEWYHKAALQGEPHAQIHLANAYYTGEQGLPQAHCHAFKWCVAAAANNNMSDLLYKRIIKGLLSQYCSIDDSHYPSTECSLKEVKDFKEQLSEKLNSLLIETHRLEVWAKGQFGDTLRNKPLQKKISLIVQTFREYERIVTQLDQPFCWINCLQLKKIIAPLGVKVNGKSYSVIESTNAFRQGNYIKELKAVQTAVSKLNSLVIALVKAGTRETMLQVLRFKQLHSVDILKDSLAYLKDIINQPEDEATILLRLQQRQHSLQSKIDILEAMMEAAVSLKSEIITIIEATVDVRNQLTLEIIRANCS